MKQYLTRLQISNGSLPEAHRYRGQADAGKTLEGNGAAAGLAFHSRLEFETGSADFTRRGHQHTEGVDSSGVAHCSLVVTRGSKDERQSRRGLEGLFVALEEGRFLQPRNEFAASQIRVRRSCHGLG